jgi:hypothetical protein
MLRSKPYIRGDRPPTEEPPLTQAERDNLFVAWLNQWRPGEDFLIPRELLKSERTSD